MHKSLKSTIFEVFGFENVHATLYTLEVGAMYRLKWFFFGNSLPCKMNPFKFLRFITKLGFSFHFIKMLVL